MAVSAFFAAVFTGDFVLALGGHLQVLDKWVRHVLYGNLDNSIPKWLVNGARAVSLVNVAAFDRDASFLVTVVVCGAIGCFLMCRRQIATAALLLLMVLGVAFIGSFLKDQLPIAQPHELHPYGFPSGHAATSMAFGCFAILVLWPMTANRMLRYGLAAAATLYVSVVGLTVLEYHYFSEIIGGYALAGSWAALLLGLRSQVARRK